MLVIGDANTPTMTSQQCYDTEQTKELRADEHEHPFTLR